MATVKLVLLMSLVAVVLTFPTEKSKSRSVQKVRDHSILISYMN